MTDIPSSNSSGAQDTHRISRALTRGTAIVIAILGFFPIANWISGGHQADWYASVLGEWLNGSLIAVGGALVLTILSRRLPIWREGFVTPLVRQAHARPRLTGLLMAGVAFLLYAAIAVRVLSGRPLFIDEISQLFQARIFASGRLWLDAPTHPEFTSILHVLDGEGKWFSQFPPGGPLMMVPGVWLHAPWITGPLAGAVSVFLFWGIARRIEPRPSVSLGAALLMATAPFVAFLAGSHMNHTTSAMWIMVAVYALVRMSEGERDDLLIVPRPLYAALAGFAFGAAASIRPVDAFAFALPAGIWMVARTIRNRACFREVVAAGAALAVPAALVLGYNALTTGHPLLFAYEYLWGKDHGLGFHRAPWGFVHSPARGLELLNLYFLRLQSYLFETPLPSLVPAIAALALARRVRAVDRYLLASVVLLTALYFSYWHDGFYLGPRFVYLAAPFLVLWTARAPALVRERWPKATQLYRGVIYTFIICGVIAVGESIPLRATQYSRGLASMRVDYTDVARKAGVEHALIFVRESWGSQLMSRMWAIGVPHSAAEGYYRNVDACQLEDALSLLERDKVRNAEATSRLLPLLADSARVVRSELSPDRSERMLPGTAYGESCQRHIFEDRAGFTLLAPLMSESWGSNVYARDLQARDTLLLARYFDRSVYLMRPLSSEEGAALHLELLRADSLRAAWGPSPSTRTTSPPGR